MDRTKDGYQFRPRAFSAPPIKRKEEQVIVLPAMSNNKSPAHINERGGVPPRDATSCRNPFCKAKHGEYWDSKGPLCDMCFDLSIGTTRIECLQSDCKTILSTQRAFSVFCIKDCQDKYFTWISDRHTCKECNTPLTDSQASTGYCASHGGGQVPSEADLAMMWTNLR